MDSENRQFEELSEKCAFILPPTSTRPMCLICQETIAAMKISNFKRHYETKNRNFEETFPQNSEVRTTKINALKSSYQAASRILVTSMTQQQKANKPDGPQNMDLWIIETHFCGSLRFVFEYSCSTPITALIDIKKLFCEVLQWDRHHYHCITNNV